MSWRTLVACALAGGLGMGLMQLSLHLYQDHLLLHALVQAEVQRQQPSHPAPPPSSP